MAIDAVVIKDDIADAPRVADLSWVHWASLNLASMEFCPALQTCTNNNLTGLGWHGPSALSISSRQGTELSVFLAHQHLLFSDGSSCVFGFSPHLPFFSFLPSIFFFLSFFFFSPWHMEIPRLVAESELQLLAFTTATATGDLSRIRDIHCSWWQRTRGPEIEPTSSWVLAGFVITEPPRELPP